MSEYWTSEFAAMKDERHVSGTWFTLANVQVHPEQEERDKCFQRILGLVRDGGHWSTRCIIIGSFNFEDSDQKKILTEEMDEISSRAFVYPKGIPGFKNMNCNEDNMLLLEINS